LIALPSKSSRGFRTVTVPESASLVPNNITTEDGKTFATVKNTDKSGGLAYLWSKDLTDNSEDAIYPALTLDTHSTDCTNVKFLKVKGKTFLVLCHMDVCLIYNANGTRRLFSVQVNKTNNAGGAGDSGIEDVNNMVWFTCCSVGHVKQTGEEFIAVATSDGRIF